jgi:AraC-like DNA-binding protein
LTTLDIKAKSAMARDPIRNPARSGGRRVNGDQLDRVEIEEASQQVGPLAEIPALLREFGCDSAQVMASAGLDADACDAPESRIPFVAAGRLLHECAVKTGCEHFALLVGQRTRLAQLGLPGQLVRHSPTLGAAVQTFAVYQHLNTQGMAKFLLEKDGMATLGTMVYQKGTEHVDQIYDIDLAATLTVIRELCGRRWSPERVLIAHAKPADAVFYRRFFQAQCRFDSERTALLFPALKLRQTLPDAGSRQLRTLEAQARARSDFGLVFRLRRTLRTLLVAEAVSGDEVARLLSMHRRTLNRRLREEGTTFQELLDEVRFEAACQFLDTSHIPISEIANSLGYAETSAFSRAFRRWSGASPVQRRRKSQSSAMRGAHRHSRTREAS